MDQFKQKKNHRNLKKRRIVEMKKAIKLKFQTIKRKPK